MTKALIIPGGPGLSPSYLRPQFDDMLQGHKVIYVNHAQAKNWADCFERVLKQIDKANLKSDDVVITHSWGSFLALEALKLRKLPCRFVFANPVPLTSKNIPDIVSNFRGRLKESELMCLSTFAEAKGTAAGILMIDLMFPAYCGRRGKLPQLDFNYWPERDAAIAQQTSKYSHLALFRKINKRSLVLFGEKDYIQPEHFGYVPVNHKLIPGGHFGYAEKVAKWGKELRNFMAQKA